MGDAAKRPAPDTSDPRPGAVVETLQLLSHDIRSAMSDVIGGLRLIDRDRLDPEAQMQVDRVQAAGDTLAALVDAALMAAVGDTLIQEEKAMLPLAQWLEALTGRWSGRARESGSEFSVKIEGTLPELVLLPQVTLDRIVGNLVGNALSHSKGAPVLLRMSGQPGEGLFVEVCDAGPGYPEEILSRLTRGVEPTSIGQRSVSGLGLRIVGELTSQIGGTLQLKNSGPGGGGCAALHLPERALAWKAEGIAPCVPPDLSGLRLLVAEDNLTNQTILRQLLEKMHADPVFVADGVAALELLEQNRFDLALIDIEMPRMSGLEVMRAVREQRDEVAKMPLVALTAYVLRDNREAIYAAGADGIIGKPISSGSDFGQAILRYAGRPTGQLEPEDVLAGRVQDDLHGGSDRKFDEERFEALLEVAGPVGRDELLQRLHEDLCAVLEALDASVAEGLVPDIRAQTHILIAISGAVGAERLNQLAEVLNIAAKRQRLDDLAALYAPCRQDLVDLLLYVTERAEVLGARLA